MCIRFEKASEYLGYLTILFDNLLGIIFCVKNINNKIKLKFSKLCSTSPVLCTYNLNL